MAAAAVVEVLWPEQEEEQEVDSDSTPLDPLLLLFQEDIEGGQGRRRTSTLGTIRKLMRYVNDKVVA